MTLSDLLSRLFDYIGSLIPFKIVQVYEQGVRVRFGKPVELVEGGRLVWYWPLIEDVVTYDTLTRTVDLDDQTVTLPGGRTVTFSGLLQYRISDALKLHTQVWEADDTVSNTVLGIFSHHAAFLPDDPKPVAFANDVQEEAEAELAEWGIEVEDVSLCNFAVVPVLRLLGSRS